MKFSAIAQKLGSFEQSSLAQFPDRDPDISGAAPVQTAPGGTISYIEGNKFSKYAETTDASALILPTSEALQTAANDREIAWISVADARWSFAQAIALFYQPFRLTPGIHPTAIIDPTATVGTGVAIGAHVVIQAHAQIGEGVCIHPNAVIYPEAMIGDRTVLHANCVIHERTQIGADCIIHSGAAIGAEGFGFAFHDGTWHKIPQSGITVLEDGVEVGCNTTIDRPAVGETRVRTNTKLDNLVHIGHNCQVGQSCAMAAQVGLAGQVQVGDRVILGGQVGVANQTQIGSDVQAGAKAGLHGHVESGSIMMGTPPQRYRDFLKTTAIYPRLPQMQRTLKELQQQIEALQKQLEASRSDVS